MKEKSVPSLFPSLFPSLSLSFPLFPSLSLSSPLFPSTSFPFSLPPSSSDGSSSTEIYFSWYNYVIGINIFLQGFHSFQRHHNACSMFLLRDSMFHNDDKGFQVKELQWIERLSFFPKHPMKWWRHWCNYNFDTQIQVSFCGTRRVECSKVKIESEVVFQSKSLAYNWDRVEDWNWEQVSNFH